MSTVYFSDNFNRVNSATLGGSWTNVYGTNSIYNNAAVCTVSSPSTTITRNTSIISNSEYQNYEVNFVLHSDVPPPSQTFIPQFRLVLWYKDVSHYTYVQIGPKSDGTGSRINFGKVDGFSENTSDTSLKITTSNDTILNIDGTVKFNRVVVLNKVVQVYQGEILIDSYTYSESDYSTTSGAFSGIGWSGIPNGSTAETNYLNGFYLDEITLASNALSGANQVRVSPTDNQVLQYSVDNINWIPATFTLPFTFTSLQYRGIEFVNNAWYAFGSVYNSNITNNDNTFPLMLRSVDGITFDYVNVAFPEPVYDSNINASAYQESIGGIAYLNGIYVTFNPSGSRTNYVSRSVDGITWTNGKRVEGSSTDRSTQLNQIGIFGNKFILTATKDVGLNEIYSSIDGITWTGHGIQFGFLASKVIEFNNEIYVTGLAAGTGSYAIKKSSNLTTWITVYSSSTVGGFINFMQTIGNKIYLGVSNSSFYIQKIITSIDGTNWILEYDFTLNNNELYVSIFNNNIVKDIQNKYYFGRNISNTLKEIIATDNFSSYERLSLLETSAQVNSYLNFEIKTLNINTGEPLIFITAVRQAEENRALVSCNISLPFPAYWVSTVLEYKLIDLNSEWVTLKNFTSPESTIVYHLNSEGYFSNGNLLYRLRTIYDGVESLSNEFQIEGDNIARYNATKTVADFKVENIIYDEAANQLQVTFRYPRPTTLSSTLPRRPQFRITDVETGRVYGSSPYSKGLNRVILDLLYQETGPTLFSSVLHSTPKSKMVYTLNLSTNSTSPIIQDFISGKKGVRLEWGWTPLLPSIMNLQTFILDSANYGYLVFYPKINNAVPTLPAAGQTEHKPDSSQGSNGGPGQIQTPSGGTGNTGGGNNGNTGVGIKDPIDIKPVIIVTPIIDGQICLTDADGVNLACGILPDGTPPNAFITIRKDKDNVYIIYDGEVVVSYIIDPVKFPNLTNSQGWVAFFDLITEVQVDVPEGSVANWLPIEGALYQVSPEETEYGMSRKRPFIYGTYQQGYTLIINGTTVSVEMEPLHDDLVAAEFYISGGTTVAVSPEIATIIANAGYAKYLKVIR